MTAERLCDRAHVGARGDVEGEPDGGAVASTLDELELVDGRAAERHLDGDTAARELVGTLAVDLHRRRCGNRQLHLAAQRGKSVVELTRRRRLVLLQRLAFRIAGRGRRPEIDVGHVALVEPDEAGCEPRRRPREQEEQPRREGIERAGVTGACARSAAQRGDERERGRAGGLVDEGDADRLQCSRRHGVACTYWRRRKSTISSIDASDEKPAA